MGKVNIIERKKRMGRPYGDPSRIRVTRNRKEPEFHSKYQYLLNEWLKTGVMSEELKNYMNQNIQDGVHSCSPDCHICNPEATEGDDDAQA